MRLWKPTISLYKASIKIKQFTALFWELSVLLSGLFSQQRTQPAPPAGQQVAPLTLLAAALSQPQIYGDERDGIIAKLNQLQAYWGTGKGFYNQQGAVDFTPQNPFCRFKVSCTDVHINSKKIKLFIVHSTAKST